MEETNEQRIRRMDAQIEKNAAAIADLIIVSRTVLTVLNATIGLQEGMVSLSGELKRGMDALREELSGYAKAAEERSREQDERINALIRAVDELIQRNGRGGESKQ